MKQVRETAAGKAISAYIVLRADGTHVATVQAFHGGSCQVDVWNFGPDNPTAAKRDAARDFGPQQYRAGGYGYDKFAAALAGVEIDGHHLTDHCGGSLKPPEGATGWPRDATAPAGYHFANWNRDRDEWGDCYRHAGLKYLEALGYRVIQAI